MQVHLKTPERQLRLPSLFLLLAGFMLFVAASLAMAWHLYAGPYDDLPTFYWATRLTFDDGVSAYRLVYFQELSQVLGQKIYPFLYPPPSALLFSPFLLCEDYEQCKSVFSVLNVLLWWGLTAVLYTLYCQAAGKNQHAVAVLVGLWIFTLVYLPLGDTLKNGQINLLVLWCLAPSFFSPKEWCWQVCSAVLLACAMILKVYLLFLLPVMLVFGRWREVLIAAVTLLVLSVASVWLLPESLWRDWLALSRSVGYGKGIPSLLTVPYNQSLNGFFIRYFFDQRGVGQATHWVWWIYGAVGLLGGLLGFVILKYLRHREGGASLALALVLLLVNLVAPLTWLHHYVFALPAVVWGAVLLQQQLCLSRTPGVMCALGFYLAAVVLLAAPQLVSSSQIAWASAAERGLSLADNCRLSVSLLAATLMFLVVIWLLARPPVPRPLFSGPISTNSVTN